MGKTTVSATLAVVASRLGMRVLIVEVEGKSGLAAMFGRPAFGYDEVELAPDVFACTVTPDAALLEYLQTHGLRRFARRLVSSGAADVITAGAPGMKDILVLGKVKSLERSGTADLVVLDAPAAGHAITFLTSPRGLLDAVRVGPVRKQAEDVTEMLTDPTRCGTILVTVAEETPVNEMIETAFALEDRVGLSLRPIVVNALYGDLDGRGPVTREAIRAAAEATAVFVPEREVEHLVRAAQFAERRRRLQQEQVSRLVEAVPLQQVPLPFVPRTDLGPDDLAGLADVFTAGVERLRGEP